MKLIAAVDKNWAIGNKGQLLVSIPQDQKMFRNETMGKVIVMDENTGGCRRARLWPDQHCAYRDPVDC